MMGSNTSNDTRAIGGTFLTIFLAGFFTMLTAFGATMWIHYRGIDWDYLVYALPRIGLIATVVATIGMALHKHHIITKLLFGFVSSLVVAFLVVGALAE